MRYCGIDVSAKAANQQLCTLHERRGPDGLELVATFYEPGTVEQVARTVHGFGRGQAVVAVDAPSGHRLDLLAAGAPLRAEPADGPDAPRPHVSAIARTSPRSVTRRRVALPGAVVSPRWTGRARTAHAAHVVRA